MKNKNIKLRKIATILYDKNYTLGEVTTSPFLRLYSDDDKELCKKYFRDIETKGYNYFLTTTKLIESKMELPDYEKKYIDLLAWVNILFTTYPESINNEWKNDGDFMEVIEEIKKHLLKIM